MSLHAQLSPEAQAKINAQKRNSTICSIIIALLTCGVLVVILFYIAISQLFKNNEEMVTYSSAPETETEEKIVKPEMNNQVEKKPSSPSSSMAKVIAANTPSATAVSVPDQVVAELSPDFGDGDDFGDGWGNESGNGADGSGFNIPASMKKRCSAKDRIERLTKEGGQEDYEEKVIRALRWLKTTQDSDGSWSVQGKPVAMTGLALLAYLGHCETPASPEFGETVEKAIVYLIANGQKNGGGLATSMADKQWCYEHPIATYALAEAYTLCKEFNLPIPKLEETITAAGDLLIANQNDNGGWAYSYITSGGHTDSSITCWQLQALKACKTTGIEFDGLKKSAANGIKYLERCKNGTGTIGYTPGSKTTSMSAGAALCYQQWGKGNRFQTRNIIQWINETNDFDYKVNANLYLHYYASQAMINARGSAWVKYNKKAMTHLADKQSDDGSWPVPTGSAHEMSSPHYATCLATLMMEVYYRFLPSSE